MAHSFRRISLPRATHASSAWAILVLVVGAVSGCPDAGAPASPQSVSLSVAVVESGVHAPLSGVEIAPLDAAGKDLCPPRVTDADGTAHCSFTLPAGHDHSKILYEVRREGYVPQRVEWRRLHSTGTTRYGGVPHGPIALERKPAGAK